MKPVMAPPGQLYDVRSRRLSTIVLTGENCAALILPAFDGPAVSFSVGNAPLIGLNFTSHDASPTEAAQQSGAQRNRARIQERPCCPIQADRLSFLW
jgi:hypothetical protein